MHPLAVGLGAAAAVGVVTKVLPRLGFGRARASWQLPPVGVGAAVMPMQQCIAGLQTIVAIANNASTSGGGSASNAQSYTFISASARVPFVDLTRIMAEEFDVMGKEKVKALYPHDSTHFNALGADLHAAAVVAGLKGLRPDPVRKFFSSKGEAVASIH